MIFFLNDISILNVVNVRYAGVFVYSTFKLNITLHTYTKAGLENCRNIIKSITEYSYDVPILLNKNFVKLAAITLRL